MNIFEKSSSFHIFSLHTSLYPIIFFNILESYLDTTSFFNFWSCFVYSVFDGFFLKTVLV